MKQTRVGLCLHDMPGSVPPHEITSDVIYIRFHGVGLKYGGDYSEEDLKPWAGKIEVWRKQGKRIYAYFNNDRGGHALVNARLLKTMAGLSA